MKKLSFLLVAALASTAHCVEITDAQAGFAVQTWIDEGASRGLLNGSRVSSVSSIGDAETGARFHVVKIQGGGVVITSADDRIDPIIAFVPDCSDLVSDGSNPFWVLLTQDLVARQLAAGVESEVSVASNGSSRARLAGVAAPESGTTRAQARWAALLKTNDSTRPKASLAAVACTPSDVRVDPFVLSRWSQSTHNNTPTGTMCYNYYTPENSVCGCVPTAGAQVMRYWRWPQASVTPLSKPCSFNGASTTYAMQGGVYDWDSMPFVPATGITDAQGQAIGKLTYDIGVSLGIAWTPNESSANLFGLALRFSDTFGFANATAAIYISGYYQYSLAELKKVIIPNCDARAPVLMSISGSGGHAVVVDGYAYSADDFCMHVNFGWGGINDAWYIPPGFGNYSAINGFVFNVFPEKSGSILSGRVLDAGGAPIEGAAVHLQQGSATIASTTSDANGIYAFIASAGSYVVTAGFLENGVPVKTAAIGVELAATTGTQLVAGSNGAYSTTSVASIGNSYGNDIAITGVAAVTPPVFSPDSCLFYPTTNVTITCADADATIRYTLDGSAPTQDSPPYAGPIFVDNTVTIRARAFADGKNPSAIVSATYTYDTAAGAPKGDFFDDPINIAGASGTYVIDDNSVYTVEAGEPLHTQRPTGNGYYTYNYQYHTVWYKWTAPGSGTVSFSTFCQKTSGNSIMRYQTLIAVYAGDTLATATRLDFAFSPDSNYETHLSLAVEQGVTYRIVGMVAGNANDSGTGVFSLSWSGDLTVTQTETSTTPVPVPYSWLDAAYPNQAANAAAYETLAFTDTDGDGFPAWAEYVANSDPTNAASRLSCGISIGAGGVPVITVHPETARDGFPRILQGKAALTDNAWTDLPAPTAGYHFYRVRIDLGGN